MLEGAARLKPHLTKVFRHLGVTTRPALKPFSDGQYIMRDFDALETRASKLKKSEKGKNDPQKLVEIDQNREKSPENLKSGPVKQPQTQLALKFEIAADTPLA